MANTKNRLTILVQPFTLSGTCKDVIILELDGLSSVIEV